MYLRTALSDGKIICNHSTLSKPRIDTGTMLLTQVDILFSFHQFVYAFFSMCIVLQNFVTCMDSCNHQHSQNTELFRHRKETPSCYLTVTPSPAPNFW